MFQKMILSMVFSTGMAIFVGLIGIGLATDLIDDSIKNGSLSGFALSDFLLLIYTLLIYAAVYISTNLIYKSHKAIKALKSGMVLAFCFTTAISLAGLSTCAEFDLNLGNALIVNSLFALYVLVNPGLYLFIVTFLLLFFQFVFNIRMRVTG